MKEEGREIRASLKTRLGFRQLLMDSGAITLCLYMWMQLLRILQESNFTF